LGFTNSTQPTDKINVISNTGPIISAFQCKKVDLLKQYYETIYIAQEQVVEFERHGVSNELEELIETGFVVIVHTTDEEKKQAESIAKLIAVSSYSKVVDFGHHLPEALAIVLMNRQELDCRAILLEEKAAREVAFKLGLPVTGFVGVLVKASLHGLLRAGEVRELLKICQQQGTRYSDAFIEEAVRLCRRDENGNTN